MELYLLKFSVCLVVFWLVYVLLLEKQQMHRFKRFYLLGSFVCALVIPQLTITKYVEPTVQSFEVSNTFIPIETELLSKPAEEPSVLDVKTILWTIYALGALLFFIRFAINLYGLYIRISKNLKYKNHNFIYVLLTEYRIPHSFFKYIFVNKYQFEDSQIPEEVKLHEETHAKQWHSLDILLLELLQIVFWFHPLVYILKHHVKLNHEFLADQAVLKHGVATKSYQNILLQFSSNTQDSKLASAINYSSFKKRFTVMKTQTSKTKFWLSTFLVLPLLAILFYSFAEKKYVELPDETSPKMQLSTDTLMTNNTQNKSIDASQELMKEYRDFITEYKAKNIIYADKYQRAIIIYDELMSDTQRASVEKYPPGFMPPSNLSKVKSVAPTKAQFEDFKNAERYAIWIDGNHVSNSVLDRYNYSDFVHVIGSKVLANARSEKFPQPYQYNLYTKKGFKNNYELAQLKKYNSTAKTYTDALSLWLKGDRNDNSELKILYHKALDIYKTFSKEEIKKHDIKMPPPPPEVTNQQNTEPKTGFLEANGQLLWYTIIDNKTTYYNKNGVITDREGKEITPGKQEYASDILPNTKVTKVYKDDKKVVTFRDKQPTKAEIKAYNSWAKALKAKINDAHATKEYPIIKVKEISHYKSIYDRMSDEQRENAEAWPNIPPPPPPAPKKSKSKGGKNVNDFDIKLQKEDNNITLKCKKGCDWEHLEFELPYNTPKIVNQYGLNKIDVRTTTGAFYFILSQDEGTFDLKSTKNTTWKGFSSSSKEKINLILRPNDVTTHRTK